MRSNIYWRSRIFTCAIWFLRIVVFSIFSWTNFFLFYYFLIINTLKNHFTRKYPANIYLFKVQHKNTRKMCKICSKSTMQKIERHQWPLSSLLLNLNVFHTFRWVIFCPNIDPSQMQLWWFPWHFHLLTLAELCIKERSSRGGILGLKAIPFYQKHQKISLNLKLQSFM